MLRKLGGHSVIGADGSLFAVSSRAVVDKLSELGRTSRPEQVFDLVVHLHKGVNLFLQEPVLLLQNL